MAKTVIFTSAKGGIGVSSLVSAVGNSLSSKGFKTLIIDLNCVYGSLDSLLNVSDKVFFNLSDVFEGNCDFVEAFREINENLVLLPSPQEVSNLDQIKTLLSNINQQSSVFDFILIDITTKADKGFNIIFNEADMILLVSGTDWLSVKATRSAADYFSQICQSCKSEIRLILNQFSAKEFFSQRGSNGFQDLDEIIDFTELQLIAIIPKDNKFFKGKAKHDRLTHRPILRAIDALADRLSGLERSISINI